MDWKNNVIKFPFFYLHKHWNISSLYTTGGTAQVKIIIIIHTKNRLGFYASKMHRNVMFTNKISFLFAFIKLKKNHIGFGYAHLFAIWMYFMDTYIDFQWWNTIFANWCRQWCKHALELMILLQKNEAETCKSFPNFMHVFCNRSLPLCTRVSSTQTHIY